MTHQTFTQTDAFRFQAQHLERWKGKLNRETYSALEKWVLECNTHIKPGTEPYVIVRGQSLTTFIENYQPTKKVKTKPEKETPSPVELEELEKNLPLMELCSIARKIRQDWKKPYFGAVPYINALATMRSMESSYGFENADSIVCYFLANASTWKGPVARLVKSELNRRLNLPKSL